MIELLGLHFSHLKGELPRDLRLYRISMLGGQCFQAARATLFLHTVWVREAVTLRKEPDVPTAQRTRAGAVDAEFSSVGRKEADASPVLALVCQLHTG